MKKMLLMFFIFFVTGAGSLLALNGSSPQEVSLEADRMQRLGVSKLIVSYEDINNLLIRFESHPVNIQGFRLDLRMYTLNYVVGHNGNTTEISIVPNETNLVTKKLVITSKDLTIYYRDEVKRYDLTDEQDFKGLTDDEKVFLQVCFDLKADLKFFLESKGEVVASEGESKLYPGGGSYTDIACIEIGGSRSIVQARVDACVKSHENGFLGNGCKVIGTDVSCLSDNHICYGSASVQCNSFLSYVLW